MWRVVSSDGMSVKADFLFKGGKECSPEAGRQSSLLWVKVLWHLFWLIRCTWHVTCSPEQGCVPDNFITMTPGSCLFLSLSSLCYWELKGEGPQAVYTPTTNVTWPFPGPCLILCSHSLAVKWQNLRDRCPLLRLPTVPAKRIPRVMTWLWALGRGLYNLAHINCLLWWFWCACWASVLWVCIRIPFEWYFPLFLFCEAWKEWEDLYWAPGKGRLWWRWGPNILNTACPQRVFGCLELTLEKVLTF